MTEAGMLIVVGGIIAVVCFSAFVTYKAEQKKRILRKRVKVLGREHVDIARNLQALVKGGELVAVA